jgi:hypothetical protein
VEATGADELILVSDAYDAADRIRSFEILIEAARGTADRAARAT